MSWVATAIIVTTVGGAYQAKKENDARKEAKEAARLDRLAALQAEKFAETEGEGLGMIGNISLSVDDDLDPNQRLGKTTTNI
jgi:hypothetical protein